MTQSVVQKTSIPEKTWRRQTDSPRWWIIATCGSVILHLLAFWLISLYGFNSLQQRRRSALPIEFIEISPQKSSPVEPKPEPKPKSVLPKPSKIRTNQAIEPIVPQNSQLAVLPSAEKSRVSTNDSDAIAFDINQKIEQQRQQQLVQQQQLQQKLAQLQLQRELAQKKELAEFQRQLEAQQRQREAEQRQLAQQLRLKAAQQRQLEAQQRQLEAQQQRRLAEQQRQLEAQQRQLEAEQQRRLAQQRQLEAEQQRRLAQQRQREAEQERRLAQQRQREAEQKRLLAEQQRQREIQQKQQLEKEKAQRQREAEERQRKLAEKLRQGKAELQSQNSATVEKISDTIQNQVGQLPKQGEIPSQGPVKNTQLNQSGGIFTASWKVETDTFFPDKPDNLAKPKEKINSNIPLPPPKDDNFQPGDFLVWLIIDNQGNLISLEVDKQIPVVQRGQYQEYAEKIFKGQKFIPASGNNGNKPDLSYLPIRVNVRNVSN